MQNTQKVFYQTGSLEIKQKPTCQLKNLFESAKASGQTTRSNKKQNSLLIKELKHSKVPVIEKVSVQILKHRPNFHRFYHRGIRD